MRQLHGNAAIEQEHRLQHLPWKETHLITGFILTLMYNSYENMNLVQLRRGTWRPGRVCNTQI